MKESTSLVLLLVLIILVSFLAGFLLRPVIATAYESSTTIDVPILEIDQCENLSLVTKVYCLRDYINTFFKFTSRNDTYHTLKDFKEDGGDCYDYSRFYKDTSSQLGLEAKIISIFSKGGKGHSFTIIWDENLTGYCKTEISKTKTSVDCIDFNVVKGRRIDRFKRD